MDILAEKSHLTRRKVLYFKTGSAKWLNGDEDNNRVCYLPGAGAVAVLRDSVYPYYSGHIRWPAATETSANLQRKLSMVMFARQDDPTPLSLAAGIAGRYQGALFTPAEMARLRDSGARTAVADHTRYGSRKDHISRLLMIVLLITVICAGATWLMIPIIGLAKG